MDLVPERLRGEVAKFDLHGKDGKVLVQKDKRITARHIRDLAEGGVKKIAVPNDYLIGRTLARERRSTRTPARSSRRRTTRSPTSC